MKKIMFGIVFLLSLFTSALTVNVTIYYEALCPDSVRFITQQLYPNYQDLKNYLTLDFVPYGKATHNFNDLQKRYIFRCQHGNMECLGNMYQACALHQTDNQEIQLEFVNCVMSGANPSNSESIAECASRSNLEFDAMKNCTLSPLGEQLLAHNGNRTRALEPNIYDVPAVVFDGSNIIDSSIQSKARTNFKQLVCIQLQEHMPDFCENGVSV